MGQKPFVARPKKGVGGGTDGLDVGAPRQDDKDAEAGPVHAAGGIMEGGGVDLNRHALGDKEGFDFGGIENPVFDLIPFGQKEDEVLIGEVEFGVAVVLKAV